jgi:hypothetical protein
MGLVDRVEVEVGAAERGEGALGRVHPQAELSTPDPQCVRPVVDGLDLAVAVSPGQQRGRGGDRGAGGRRGEAQHGVHPGLVGDQVQIVGVRPFS